MFTGIQNFLNIFRLGYSNFWFGAKPGAMDVRKAAVPLLENVKDFLSRNPEENPRCANKRIGFITRYLIDESCYLLLRLIPLEVEDCKESDE